MGPTSPDGQATGLGNHFGVLAPALRQRLADLNRQYLELGLEPELADDPRFAWAPAVRRRLQDVVVAERNRLAAVPFALFRLEPPGGPSGAAGVRVEDTSVADRSRTVAERLASFAHQAAFLASTLAGTIPLASSLLLGLGEPAQVLLREALPSQLAAIAAHPSLIRPRWPAHETWWTLVVDAARRGTVTGLRWTHCFGLCLLGAADARATIAVGVQRSASRR
jgi:hypothetical protein